VACWPLYAVDLDQRVIYWDERTASSIAAPDDAVGRHCYEVLPNLDPRNGRRCRPNCQVIQMARAGQAAPDFEVWGAFDGEVSRRRDISILLHTDTELGEMAVVHLVRTPPGDDARCPAPEGSALAALAEQLPRNGTCVSPDPGDGPSLTRRQRETLRLLASGRDAAAIADELGLRPVTVRNHIQSAMERLGARSRLEAVLRAAEAGLL